MEINILLKGGDAVICVTPILQLQVQHKISSNMYIDLYLNKSHCPRLLSICPLARCTTMHLRDFRDPPT